jgi:predicted dehydrogenase
LLASEQADLSPHAGRGKGLRPGDNLQRALSPDVQQQWLEDICVQQVEAAVIGVGWVGGTRAETLSRTALVDKLHLCDIRPGRLAEVKQLYRPATATLDYKDIINNPNISVVYISTTPESNHYPICRDCLKAGKNVMLEKPIALELWEADELILLAQRGGLKFTIGYSQRFNTKFAYAKKKITDGTLGKVVSVLVSRHLSRSLGKKIASRVRLSPVVMESTHDLDFVFWLLEPAKPVRVYSQGAYGFMQPVNGSYDVMFSIVTMDNGTVVMIGGGWNLPPSYPNFCSTWVEILGTEGALILDDTHREHWMNTVSTGQEFPMSTMPGEQVDHVFAGGMGPETIHFLEACIKDRPVMVTPESARMVMETYTAADLSADRNEPVDLPLTNATISAVAEMKEKHRSGLNA